MGLSSTRARARRRTTTVVTALAAAAVLPLGGIHPAAASSAVAPAAVAGGVDRPNVVVVLADDLGWSDLGSRRVNGRTAHDFHDTPGADGLAGSGTAFDNAYATPTCSPTRMALLTGLAASRPDNNVFAVKDLSRGTWRATLTPPRQGRADGALVLPGGAITVAENVKRAGYHTGFVGKFHVTGRTEDITRRHGFDVNYGGSAVTRTVGYHARGGRFGGPVDPSLDRFAGDYTQDYVDRHLRPHSHGVPAGALDRLVGTPKHLTDAVADATTAFIDSSAGRPFFAFVSHWAVHAPIGRDQVRTDLLAKYDAKPRRSHPSDAPYAAMVEGFDQTLSRLRRHLERTPDLRHPGRSLAETTVVVVTSDNGGRASLGGHNRPLRGQKGELHEGGIRVPWFAWSANPALVRPGVVNHSVIDGTDLYPTVSDLAGVPVPARVHPDGTSLRGVLARGTRIDRPRFVHMPGYLVTPDRTQNPETVVRRGPWKLRYTYQDRRWRLYNLASDIGERRDLARKRTDVVWELGTTMLRWLAEVRAPLPTLARHQPPARVTVRGRLYTDERLRALTRPTTVTVRPGQQMPVVLPRP